MIAVPLSKVRRFFDLFSARFEQNSGEHRYLATLLNTDDVSDSVLPTADQNYRRHQPKNSAAVKEIWQLT
jgi:hypothetical protein